MQRSREERRQNNEGQQSMATEDQRQAKLEDNPISPIKANHPQDTNPLEERRRLLRERLQRSSEKKADIVNEGIFRSKAGQILQIMMNSRKLHIFYQMSNNLIKILIRTYCSLLYILIILREVGKFFSFNSPKCFFICLELNFIYF